MSKTCLLGILENATDIHKKCAALAPHFATEEAALEYAKRLAQLRPGDNVRIINPNFDGYMNAIFIGMMGGEDSECAKCLFYDTAAGGLRSARISLATVRID